MYSNVVGLMYGDNNHIAISNLVDEVNVTVNGIDCSIKILFQENDRLHTELITLRDSLEALTDRVDELDANKAFNVRYYIKVFASSLGKLCKEFKITALVVANKIKAIIIGAHKR